MQTFGVRFGADFVMWSFKQRLPTAMPITLIAIAIETGIPSQVAIPIFQERQSFCHLVFSSSSNVKLALYYLRGNTTFAWSLISHMFAIDASLRFQLSHSNVVQNAIRMLQRELPTVVKQFSNFSQCPYLQLATQTAKRITPPRKGTNNHPVQ